MNIIPKINILYKKVFFRGSERELPWLQADGLHPVLARCSLGIGECTTHHLYIHPYEFYGARGSYPNLSFSLKKAYF